MHFGRFSSASSIARYMPGILATAPITTPAPTTTILGQARFDSFRADARQLAEQTTPCETQRKEEK